MSLFTLAAGSLIADPVSRTGASGKAFVTANLRVTADGDTISVSLIAFGTAADELLAQRRGGQIAVSGRTALRSWAGKDGETKTGLSVVCEQVVSAAAARRIEATRRREIRDTGHVFRRGQQ